MRLLKMEIAPDRRMIPVALSAVRAAAGLFFKDAASPEHIALALEEAIANVTEFCLSDQLESIGIEAELTDDNAFAVTVTDKGLPGELDKILEGDKALGLTLMSRMVDKVSVSNMGTDGRSQKMVKYISEKPAFELRRSSDVEEADASEELIIRPVRENETLEVARCIYDEFGFTYLNETVYYPERFWSAIMRGEIFSLVAATASGEVAAHLALWKWGALPGIWEMGMGVVKRKFRKAHIMSKLTEAIVEYARDEMKLPGFICEPVLYHPYTQKVANSCGFHACGAGLLYAPESLEPTMSSAQGKRSNVAMAMSVYQREARKLYLPEELQGFIGEILGRMELPAQIIIDIDLPAQESSEVATEAFTSFRFGRVAVYKIGKDIKSSIHRMTLELIRQNVEVIEMFLPLNDKGAAAAYSAAKSLGYFCTGFLPMSERGDMLIMERLLAHAVDYGELKTVEPFTGLIESIRKLDPNEMMQAAD